MPGWYAANLPFRVAVDAILDGKVGLEREDAARDMIACVHASTRGATPPPHASGFDKDGYYRECWTRYVAHTVDQLVGFATERLSYEERDAVMLEIARYALWSLPNCSDQARKLAKQLEIDRLAGPGHPRDTPPAVD
jgi:hypothetical protein